MTVNSVTAAVASSTGSTSAAVALPVALSASRRAMAPTVPTPVFTMPTLIVPAPLVSLRLEIRVALVATPLSKPPLSTSAVLIAPFGVSVASELKLWV